MKFVSESSKLMFLVCEAIENKHPEDIVRAWVRYKKYKGFAIGRTVESSGRRNTPDNSPAASWESGTDDEAMRTCACCNRVFRTRQGLGLHFTRSHQAAGGK